MKLVDYFRIEAAPHLEFFRCERMSASLSTIACASNWRQAHDAEAERLFKCRTCPVGAVHAGETAASLSPLRGAMICSRCHRGATKLVRGHLCVPCYNREGEIIKGKNAKGSAPVKLAPLHRRSIRVLEGGEPRMFARPLTANIEELMVTALRDCRRQVIFTWDHNKPALFAQRRLF